MKYKQHLLIINVVGSNSDNDNFQQVINERLPELLDYMCTRFGGVTNLNHTGFGFGHWQDDNGQTIGEENKTVYSIVFDNMDSILENKIVNELDNFRKEWNQIALIPVFVPCNAIWLE